LLTVGPVNAKPLPESEQVTLRLTVDFFDTAL